MADCSKAIEFSRELYRLCDFVGSGYCSDTCLFNNDSEHTCPYDREITQEDVDIVQKWSDEHPEPKTYADDVFEKLPAANRVNGRPAFCRKHLYGTPSRWCDGNISNLSADDCIQCWNEVMHE